MPVFKAGISEDIVNYWPISIMGSTGNVVDTLMSEKITDKVI